MNDCLLRTKNNFELWEWILEISLPILKKNKLFIVYLFLIYRRLYNVFLENKFFVLLFIFYENGTSQFWKKFQYFKFVRYIKFCLLSAFAFLLWIWKEYYNNIHVLLNKGCLRSRKKNFNVFFIVEHPSNPLLPNNLIVNKLYQIKIRFDSCG